MWFSPDPDFTDADRAASQAVADEVARTHNPFGQFSRRPYEAEVLARGVAWRCECDSVALRGERCACCDATRAEGEATPAPEPTDWTFALDFAKANPDVTVALNFADGSADLSWEDR